MTVIAPEQAQITFCPKCATRLEDMVDDVNERVRPPCPECGWIYYPTNGIGARSSSRSG
jgi:hypothetical protein